MFKPVTLVRVYAAASAQGVKMGAWAGFLGPWVAQFGVSYICIFVIVRAQKLLSIY